MRNIWGTRILVPVLSGRAAESFMEGLAEIAAAVESAGNADLCHGKQGVNEKITGFAEPVVHKVGKGGLAKSLLKTTAAFPGAYECRIGKLFEGQLFVVVGCDIFHHNLNAVILRPPFFV